MTMQKLCKFCVRSTELLQSVNVYECTVRNVTNAVVLSFVLFFADRRAVWWWLNSAAESYFSIGCIGFMFHLCSFVCPSHSPLLRDCCNGWSSQLWQQIHTLHLAIFRFSQRSVGMRHRHSVKPSLNEHGVTSQKNSLQGEQRWVVSDWQ